MTLRNTRSLASGYKLSFEEQVKQAVKDGVMPGAVMLAKDKTGKYHQTIPSVNI